MDKNGHEPSGALIKALLINGATDLENQTHRFAAVGSSNVLKPTPLTIGAAPNCIQGFGMLNIDNALLPILAANPNEGGYVSSHALPVNGHWGQSVKNKFDSDLTVTMTWTDPRGAELQQYFELSTYLVNADGDKKFVPETWKYDTPADWTRMQGAPNKAAENNNVQRLTWKRLPANKTVRICVECKRTYAANETADFACAWYVKKS